MRNLTLYIPCLLGFHANDLYSDFPEPQSLSFILGRSNKTIFPAATYTEQLARLFELFLPDANDFPAASISRLIDDAERPEGWWMRADPVHLSTNAQGVTLFDVSRLQLDQHEALALGAKLQSLFNQHQYELEVPVADRWYVKVPHQPLIQTRDIFTARGNSILNLMPRGTDQTHWQQFMNEIQMLLHDSDINQARESAAKLPVNSLWFWGSGQLPGILPRTWTTVYADDVLVHGLCMLSGTGCQPVDSFLANVPEKNDDSELLVVIDAAQTIRAYQDLSAWHDFIEYVDKVWMSPLVNQMHLNQIGSLTLITDTEKFTFRKMHLLKFWKGSRKFSQHLMS